MIQPNRTWSVSLTKESLLKEIDDEIQKEYQILNKFSSEKFSIILVIFGVLTLIVAIWPSISPFIDKTQMVLFYIISANLLIIYWSYWEIIKSIILARFKKLNPKKTVEPKISMNIFQMLITQISGLDVSERDKFKFFLMADWIYAKKGEPHSWAFLIFLSTLIGISYANIQGWIEVPHLNDQMIFGLTFSMGLIIFSFIMIFANYYLNIRGFFWENLLDAFEIIKDRSNSGRKMLFIGIFTVIIGFLSMIIWTFFSNIFPILLLWFCVVPNLALIFNDLLNNLVILFFFMVFLNLLVEFLAVFFGINLVENVKNEKIWWLETIREDINSFSLEHGEHEIQLELFYKKFDCSDIYIPVPIQRFFIFQKYVFLPKWLMKPTIDIDTCDNSDFKILKERFDSHKNLIYRNKIQ